MIWYIDILKIYLEQLMMKYYVIKHLILLKIQNMIDINVDLLQWFTATHANKSAVAMHANRSANQTEIEINLENWQLATEIGKTIIRKPKK